MHDDDLLIKPKMNGKMQPTEGNAPPKLCIYHGPGCQDGFMAAWVVRKFCQRNGVPVEFLAAQYGDTPPSVIGRDVIIVDFSYPLDVLETMMATATSITLLDHHKTAKADLEKLNVRDNSMVTFDMDRSGAGIAWDTFFHGEPRPPLLNMVEDRDLWRYRIPFTRHVTASLMSQPYDFDLWDKLVDAAATREGAFILGVEGEAILRKHDKDIAELITLTKRHMWFGGSLVPVANLPPTMASDAGNVMAKEHDVPFAATYYDKAGERVFSLRSVGEFDVSNVAKHYGGGGHKNAAGFKMHVGWEGDQS